MMSPETMWPTPETAPSQPPEEEGEEQEETSTENEQIPAAETESTPDDMSEQPAAEQGGPKIHEMTPAQRAEEEKFYEEVKQELGSFWELLPQRTKPTIDNLVELLEQTKLGEELTILIKRSLANFIIKNELQKEPKGQFISRCFNFLKPYVYGTGMKRDADKRLAEQSKQIRASARELRQKGMEIPYKDREGGSSSE